VSCEVGGLVGHYPGTSPRLIDQTSEVEMSWFCVHTGIVRRLSSIKPGVV
jgi:hypothetical protein